MTQEEINKICNIEKEIDSLEADKSILTKKLRDEFLEHPQWSTFLERHGVPGYSDNMGGHQYFYFYFKGDTCRIEVKDVFRNELISDDFTRYFKVTELIDFLSNPNYYTPLFERLKSIKKVREEKAKAEAEKEEFKLYERLKEKFEQAKL